MKNKTFIQSIICAIKGFIYTLKTEKNYRYYATITLVFLIINIIVKVEFYCYIFQIFTSLGVFSCECINTAIEHLCNKMTMEIDAEIKFIKDIAAGAVFVGVSSFLRLNLFL